MSNGWVKLHKKIAEWEWYEDGNTFRVFLHLLLFANFEDKYWHGKLIKRGQVIIGTIKLAKQLGLTRQNIRTSIANLKSTNEITTKSTTHNYTVVTIQNYDFYQQDNHQINQQTNHGVTTNQPTTNHNIRNKEYKEEEEGKKKGVQGKKETGGMNPPPPPLFSLDPEKVIEEFLKTTEKPMLSSLEQWRKDNPGYTIT